MKHLIAVWDDMFTGSECYMLSDAELSIEDLARKALTEYISLWGDKIGDKHRFIQQGLTHYDNCPGCTDSRRVHELGIDIREDQFEQYKIDENYFQEDAVINVRVLNLEQHPKLEQLCVSSPIMKPEELLRSTSVNFKDKGFLRKLANTMMYSK
jgi:hypothetical protein